VVDERLGSPQINFSQALHPPFALQSMAADAGAGARAAARNAKIARARRVAAPPRRMPVVSCFIFFFSI
jgi:hypothetical protein